MKTCIICGDVVYFKGEGMVTCDECKCECEKCTNEKDQSKDAIVVSGYSRFKLSDFKIPIKVEKL